MLRRYAQISNYFRKVFYIQTIISVKLNWIFTLSRWRGWREDVWQELSFPTIQSPTFNVDVESTQIM